MCLDLSDCEFQDQQSLLKALSTLPCLRTLVLEGNPFTLAPCYPGFTVDSLPQLSCLDGSWISPEERHCFRGLAKKSGETLPLVDLTPVNVGLFHFNFLSKKLCNFIHMYRSDSGPGISHSECGQDERNPRPTDECG